MGLGTFLLAGNLVGFFPDLVRVATDMLQKEVNFAPPIVGLWVVLLGYLLQEKDAHSHPILARARSGDALCKLADDRRFTLRLHLSDCTLPQKLPKQLEHFACRLRGEAC